MYLPFLFFHDYSLFFFFGLPVFFYYDKPIFFLIIFFLIGLFLSQNSLKKVQIPFSIAICSLIFGCVSFVRFYSWSLYFFVFLFLFCRWEKSIQYLKDLLKKYSESIIFCWKIRSTIFEFMSYL